MTNMFGFCKFEGLNFLHPYSSGRFPFQNLTLPLRPPAHPPTAHQGDNDPVDVVEIGSQRCEMGGVYAVKPLGVYAMVDDGEVDWKVVCIRADDPKAGAVHDVEVRGACVCLSVHFPAARAAGGPGLSSVLRPADRIPTWLHV
jgi:hypothetical protein